MKNGEGIRGKTKEEEDGLMIRKVQETTEKEEGTNEAYE